MRSDTESLRCFDSTKENAMFAYAGMKQIAHRISTDDILFMADGGGE